MGEASGADLEREVTSRTQFLQRLSDDPPGDFDTVRDRLLTFS